MLGTHRRDSARGFWHPRDKRGLRNVLRVWMCVVALAHRAGFAGLLYHNWNHGRTGLGGFFGSGPSRSRAEVTEVEVRACGDRVAWDAGGGGGPGAAGSAGFAACDDAKHGAEGGDSVAGAANDASR